MPDPQAHSDYLQVQVTDLWWTTEVDVQQQKQLIQANWQEALPPQTQGSITILKSERKPRGTEQYTKGYHTQQVNETYQQGTRTETYTEPERYQSGTRTETYTATEPYQVTRTESYLESQRYQSGSRTESYTTTERYQSGSRQDCKTTSQGNGLGKRTCRTIPTYSTRKVKRDRQVPVYSTRQVPRTRTVTQTRTRTVTRSRQVPVYSTRQARRSRMVPAYKTRQNTIKEPILATRPVYDTWVTYQRREWIPKQTYKRTGKDDVPRQWPQPVLPQSPAHRINAKRTTCRLHGRFPVSRGALQDPRWQPQVWVIPCEHYDRVNIGDSVKLQEQEAGKAILITN